MKYLKKLPVSEYRFGQDWFHIRDVFVRLRLLDSIRDNPAILTTITLNNAERADVVAHRLYGNSDLYWTLYLVNDIIDPAEWIMGDQQLAQYVKDKHENPFAVSHEEQRGKMFDRRAANWYTTRKPFKTTDSEPNNLLTDPTTVDKITHYQNEERLNDSKRVIRAIRKEYMAAFITDVENKLRGLKA